MKRVILFLAAMLMASTGLWAETVKYIDADGQETTVDAAVVTDADELVTWGAAGTTTWYVVTGTEVTLSEGAICVGDVRLILADGAKLTATGDETAGIQVSGDGNALTIYGQTGHLGQLFAIGDFYAAGIGGENFVSGSNITINGGRVTAIGGEGAAGIGGGCNEWGYDITINGGRVMAIGGEGAAGIGGGNGGSSANIKVSTTLLVKADAGNPPTTLIENSGGNLATILRGKQCVNILPTVCAAYIDANGDTKEVKAVEIESSDTSVVWSNGWYVVNEANVTLSKGAICVGEVHLILADGAKLTATGDDTAGIQVSGEGNSLTIYGQTGQTGQLIATGGNNAAGIGGGNYRPGSNITINGGVVTATGGNYASGIGGGNYGSSSNIWVSTTLLVKADKVNPPVEEIDHDGGDIALELKDKRYVIIEPIRPYRDAAIAAINAAFEGVTNEIMKAIANNAKTSIEAAITTKAIDAIKENALTDLQIYDVGKADALGSLGTEQTGPAVKVTDKDGKAVILYAPKKVEYIKVNNK